MGSREVNRENSSADSKGMGIKRAPRMLSILTATLAAVTAGALLPNPAMAGSGVSGGGWGFASSTDSRQRGSAQAAASFAKVPSTSAAATATSVGALPVFGTQFHGMWSSYTDKQRAMVLDKLKANGVTTVRLDVSWAMLQPKSATFDTWGTGFVTRVLKMITDRGLEPMMMIWLTPSWVTGSTDDRVAPKGSAQLDQWRTFLSDAAARFPQVKYWELWNEPNHNDFMRGADPQVYAALLSAGHRGIKAGNPNAQVIFAGTQFVDVPWIQKAFAAGAAGKYDVMGVHPYMAVGNLSPTSADDGTIWRMRHVPALRTAMLAAGDDKPIWFTEFGWRAGSTGTANWQLGVDQATQAKYLAATLSMVKTEWPYVTRVFWYRELADNNTANSSGYGLILPNGTVKPALTQIPGIYAKG